MTKINYVPTDIRYFIGVATLAGGGEDVVVFTTCQAEIDHIRNGGKLCGKIAMVSEDKGHTYAHRNKVVALRESGCSMTRAGFTPEQVERQNAEYDKAIKHCGLNNG